MSIPRHVAIIMDGNGRWAASKFLPRIAGHQQGVKAVKKIVKQSLDKGIGFLTLYAFSNENWKRPEEEVSLLMKMFEHFIQAELNNLIENGVRLRFIGRIDELGERLANQVRMAEETSKNCDKLNLTIAVSYGSRQEMVDSFKKLASQYQDTESLIANITEENISSQMYKPEIGDVDLLIRTSAEHRISNFLLWQIAYSEIVFCNCMWPEFDEKEFDKCLEVYSTRERRFGKTSQQLKAKA